VTYFGVGIFSLGISRVGRLLECIYSKTSGKALKK